MRLIGIPGPNKAASFDHHCFPFGGLYIHGTWKGAVFCTIEINRKSYATTHASLFMGVNIRDSGWVLAWGLHRAMTHTSETEKSRRTPLRIPACAWGTCVQRAPPPLVLQILDEFGVCTLLVT
jgi:hypothetical protein